MKGVRRQMTLTISLCYSRSIDVLLLQTVHQSPMWRIWVINASVALRNDIGQPTNSKQQQKIRQLSDEEVDSIR